jgi:electron transfer flavoprotein alpha subunit
VDVVENPEHRRAFSRLVKIVVLVKQVPRPDAIAFDEETKTLRREGVPLELNHFCRLAVQQAVVLREQAGGEVVTMTMGPPQAEEALRETLSLGADRAVHLSDPVFAVADTLGTSRTLALALGREGADLVLCGVKATDSETWQVPPEVAAFLGRPHLVGVTALERDGAGLVATVQTDEGSDRYAVPLPAVVSVLEAEPTGDAAAGASRELELVRATDLADDLRPDDRRFGQRGSPTRVLAVRDVTPERLGAIASSVDDAVARVRALLRAVTPDTAWEKPPRLGERPGASYDCWTLVELVAGRPARVSLELLAKGRELSGKLGGQNVALVIGDRVDDAVQEAIRHGAELVHTVADERLADYQPELWQAAVRRVVETYQPHVLLIPATARGRDFGPRVAGELELGMTADCVALNVDRAGRLIQTKPAYGGNIVSVIMGATTPQLATVRPRMFAPLDPRDDADGSIEPVEVGALPEPRLRLLERREDSAAYELDEADLVVCLGPGFGGPIPDLPGAALGGTREVCAAGRLPRNRQIGLHGRAVAPRVLVAAGVPGESEHLSGFVKANVVVAVDADPASPMLNAANVGIVADPAAVLPELVTALTRPE